MKSGNSAYIKTLVIFASLYGGQAVAEQVGALTTFTAGTTAKASEVNGNFDAVKTAVNDNETRLTAAEGSVTLNTYNIDQTNAKANNNATDITTNATDISTNTANIAINSGDIATNASDITAVQTDVTAIQATVDAIKTNSVVISAMAMQPTLGSGCILDYSHTAGYANFNSASSLTICNMVSPVNFPNGATPGILACNLWDNDAGGAPVVSLRRAANDGSSTGVMYQTNGVADSAAVQPAGDLTNALTGTIDNNTYNYYLVFENGGVDTSTAGNAVRFYNCRVTYTLP